MNKHSDDTETRKPSEVRDRLLLAAAELLHASGGEAVSTRAICARAGVQAPTLYHYFGSKQGLLDAVVNHGFTQYVTPDHPTTGSGDPLQDLRDGWDCHVQFGLEHPTFYALLYGRVLPGIPCTITAPAEAMLRERLAAAARRGLLRVPPEDAAAQLLAANVGVTLHLIAQPDATRDLGLSERMREAALAGILSTAGGPGRTGSAPARATAAIALSAALDQDPSALSPGELALLHELLARISHVNAALDSGKPS